jgi:ABC-type transport system involved in multi-copper enzyme maturation permease subunit
VRSTWVVFGYALRESLRRRVFHAGLVLTVVFLSLYGLGCSFVNVSQVYIGPASRVVKVDVYAAATVLGLAVFATYFFGVSLAIFLTISAVRGDAEQGVLQSLIVRPLMRWQFLLGRLLAAVAVAVFYVAIVFAVALAITQVTLGWTPRHALAAGLEISAAIVVVAVVSMLSSVYLSGVANGIGVFMLFGAGLFGGLLGQIGGVVNSHKLEQTATIVRYVTPFEWLYQSSLGRLIEGENGVTEMVIRLGPFGGSVQGGTVVWLWSAVYVLAMGGATVLAFARRDL